MCAQSRLPPEPTDGASEIDSERNWQEVAEQMAAEHDPEKMLQLADELNLLLLEREHRGAQSNPRNIRRSPKAE